MVLFIIFIHSAIFSFGIARSVFTGSTLPLIHLIVDVTVRRGFTTSLSAYFAPRGHVFPVTDCTFPSVISARSSHPRGHTIQVSFLSIIVPPKYTLPPIFRQFPPLQRRSQQDCVPEQRSRTRICRKPMFHDSHPPQDHL